MSLPEVEKIANLARISIHSKDIPSYTRHLSDILNFVEQINRVDTTGISPLAHPLDTYQRLRADVVSETNLRDDLQGIAPQVKAGIYLVPKVIE